MLLNVCSAHLQLWATAVLCFDELQIRLQKIIIIKNSSIQEDFLTLLQADVLTLASSLFQVILAITS